MSDNKGLKLLTMASTMKVKDMAESIKVRIETGEVNPAVMGVVLKKFAKLFETVNDDKEIKQIIFDETSKYKEGNKKTIELLGAKITIGSVRTWWEYNECGDPYWDNLDSIEKQIKILKKERETQLQSFVPKLDNIMGITTKAEIIERLPVLIWEESGEIVQIVPPVKKSTDGLKYSV